MPRIAVIGAGAWGTALSIIAAKLDHDTTLVPRTEETAARLREQRQNSRYLLGATLPDNLAVEAHAAGAIRSSDIAIVAVPSVHMRTTIETHLAALSEASIIVSATKGLEIESGMRMSQVIADVLAGAQAADLGDGADNAAAGDRADDGPGGATATAGADDGPGDATATAGADDRPGDATATAGADDGSGGATATAGADDGSGGAAATAGADDGSGGAAATAGADDGPGGATATAGADDGSGGAAATAGATSWRTPRLCALSGPNLAAEISRGLPALATVASRDIAAAEFVQQHLSGMNYRLYASTDIIGVELGGTLKNVIGIGAGVIDAAELGANAKASYVTRGISEMTRLGVAMGAQASTFAGLSGVGDALATCYSTLSRNYRLGALLGSGMPLAQALQELGQTAEGVPTTSAAVKIAQRLGVELPITQAAHKVLFEGVDLVHAISALMQRELVREG